MNSDSYAESWEIYKAHSEVFKDDFRYYNEFCQGHSSLELFAGYGRIGNHLIEQGVELETVELSPSFSGLINLPVKKRHVSDVLEFHPEKKWDRIIAGYNSFCLLKTDEQVQKFFHNLASWLTDDGMASLNYYHTDYWKDAVAYDFDFRGKKVSYNPSWSLEEIENQEGEWIDEYKLGEQVWTHAYNVRVYRRDEDLIPFLDNAGLKLVHRVENFGEAEVMEPGWIDYVVAKK